MTKQPKQQNLKLSKIKKVSKQLDITETHIIQSENYKGEQITFQPIFDEITIDNLFAEYQHLFLEAKEKELEISQEMQIILLSFLTIKHFTHFKSDIPSTFIEILDWIEHFRKTGLYKEILESVFLPQEISKIFSRLTDFVATSMVHNDLEAETQRKFESLKLKNQFVFDQLANLKVGNESDEENNVVQ